MALKLMTPGKNAEAAKLLKVWVCGNEKPQNYEKYVFQDEFYRKMQNIAARYPRWFAHPPRVPISFLVPSMFPVIVRESPSVIVATHTFF